MCIPKNLQFSKKNFSDEVSFLCDQNLFKIVVLQPFAVWVDGMPPFALLDPPLRYATT